MTETGSALARHIKNTLTWLLAACGFFLGAATVWRSLYWSIHPLAGCGGQLAAASVPDTLTAGVLAQEDPEFWDHRGIDFASLWTSLRRDISRHNLARGGSTVTMQVSSWCRGDRAEQGVGLWLRKLGELYDSAGPLRDAKPGELLRAYLTLAPLLPDSVPGRGFPAAARYYFHRELAELTPEQGWRLTLALRDRRRFSPERPLSLEALPPEDRDFLARTRQRQSWELDHYHDRIERLPFTFSRQTVDELLRTATAPVSVSPRGNLRLVQSHTTHAFELRVLRADGRRLFSRLFENAPVSPTWSPDSRRIALFLDRGGDRHYRLFLLDLDKQSVVPLASPPIGLPRMAWSPDGKRIALVTGEGTRRDLVVLTFPDGRTQVEQRMPGLTERSRFAWSPDGKRIAITAIFPGSGVTILSVGASSYERLLPDTAFSEVAWGPRSLYVTGYPSDADFTALGEIKVPSRKEKAPPKVVWFAAPVAGDVRSPVIAGGSVLYRLERDGNAFLFAHTRDKEMALVTAPGASEIVGVEHGGSRAWARYTGLRSPPTLLAVALRGRAPAAKPLPAPLPDTVESQSLRLGASDGVVAPAYLWRADREPGENETCLIEAHMGVGAPFTREWDPVTALLVRRGISVLALNARGSGGYGRRFEEQTGDPLLDLEAAIRYCATALHVRSSRIWLKGHDVGTDLVARAAMLDRDRIGGVVLLSSLPSIGIAGRAPWHVLAFQGENDPLAPPAVVLKHLISLWGDPWLSPEGSWLVFPNEGHDFHRLSSWARIVSSFSAAVEGAE